MRRERFSTDLQLLTDFLLRRILRTRLLRNERGISLFAVTGISILQIREQERRTLTVRFSTSGFILRAWERMTRIVLHTKK